VKLKFYCIRKNAKLPHRAHSSDAGLDLFYCPDDINTSYKVYPGTSGVLPSGLKVEIPYGYMLEIKNKSGIASKRQLLVGACVVDSGYDGEIFINLHNVGSEVQTIEPGDKIAQAILLQVQMCDIVEAESGESLNFNSSRGSGGFGSTGG
jgi:dUTP pyrophosphatase